MKNVKEFFHICVDRYVPDKKFYVMKPASLWHPKDHAVMFIGRDYIEQAYVLGQVEQCLVFWPEDVAVPQEIIKNHAVYPCENPHKEYCRFFRDNQITYLPPQEKMQCINGAWISEEAVIGERTVIMPGAYVGGECVIGDDVYIGTGVRLVGRVIIGNRVVIRENTVIGADGLSTDREKDGTAITMPQFGKVVLEDDVQVGALSVIARGAIDETRIGKGSKIDNSSFISHNVRLGKNTFVVGETIMFGSSSTGDNVFLSGNASVRNGIHIGDGARVGMGAVVVKPVAEGAIVKGNPAR